MTAAIALAVEQQTQKLLVETQLDITEFDNLLQPIIDTCTKDAISVSRRRIFQDVYALISNKFKCTICICPLSGWEELDV